VHRRFFTVSESSLHHSKFYVEGKSLLILRNITWSLSWIKQKLCFSLSLQLFNHISIRVICTVHLLLFQVAVKSSIYFISIHDNLFATVFLSPLSLLFTKSGAFMRSMVSLWKSTPYFLGWSYRTTKDLNPVFEYNVLISPEYVMHWSYSMS